MVLPNIIPLVKHVTTKKVAITIDRELLKELDSLVSNQIFPNRSKAIQEAVKEKLERLKRIRLSMESAKLNIDEEQHMAEEGMGDKWPEY